MNDFARSDTNELCIRLRLLAEDLELSSASPELAMKRWLEVIDFKIYQKTDFFMFCLSQVYDWRLFGDFNADAPSDERDDEIACLVITDPVEFKRRFAAAASTFKSQDALQFSDELQLKAGSVFYYDACDPQECAPLFQNKYIMPFAKRREFTYQHEFRFVLKPELPEDFLPTSSPEEIPRFQRAFLNLGSLEDISYIVEPDRHPPNTRTYYLSIKDPVLLASAVGVTLPNSGDMARFSYSVESKEKGRTNAPNLTNPTRFSGGSMGLHEQHIHVPADTDQPSMLRAVRAFYSVFDVREHGNHLIGFEACDAVRLWKCTYRAYLPCGEPADGKIDTHSLLFEFEYSFRDSKGCVSIDTEQVEMDGDTYLAQFNGVGPLHLHATYRSLLLAEMEFIQRLIGKGINGLISYEARNRETGYRCSEFKSFEATATEILRNL
jgi:hypothetical protein